MSLGNWFFWLVPKQSDADVSGCTRIQVYPHRSNVSPLVFLPNSASKTPGSTAEPCPPETLGYISSPHYTVVAVAGAPYYRPTEIRQVFLHRGEKQPHVREAFRGVEESHLIWTCGDSTRTLFCVPPRNQYKPRYPRYSPNRPLILDNTHGVYPPLISTKLRWVPPPEHCYRFPLLELISKTLQVVWKGQVTHYL